MTESTSPSRGFTLSEIIFSMAFAFFMIGIILGTFYNGNMIREMCWVMAGILVVAGIVFAIISVKAEEVKKEDKPDEMTPAAWGLVFWVLIIFVVLTVAITYAGDRQSNPTEEFCHNIGTNIQEFSSLERAVVLETGQCVKNETGFHANGKAIFP